MSSSLTGETVDQDLIEGFDNLDLFLAGRLLRTLLDQLAAAGALSVRLKAHRGSRKEEKFI